MTTTKSAYSALMMFEVYGKVPTAEELSGMKAEFYRLCNCRSDREKLLLARYSKALSANGGM